MNENTVNSTENVQTTVEETQKNKRLRNALIRTLAALLAACVLLAIPGLAIFTIFKGPEPIVDIENAEPGSFVSSDVNFFLWIYPEQEGGIPRYAAMFMNGRIVSVRFTDRYLENVDEIVDETYEYLQMRQDVLDKYLKVRGTIGELSESVSGLMYSWFDYNYSQLLELGLPPTEDYATYLSDTVLLVDTVNGYSETSVFVMAGLAALLLLYVMAELTLMCVGFYKPAEETCVCGCEECGDDAEISEETKAEETADETETASETEQADSPVPTDSAEPANEAEAVDNADSKTEAETADSSPDEESN